MSTFDYVSTTERGAAAFERGHGGGPFIEEPPSASDLAGMAEEDRRMEQRQAERDRAARARGEYVPSDAMRAAASSLRWTLALLGGLDVECSREGVLRVAPGRGPTPPIPLALEAVQGAYRPGDVDVQVAGGAIWVRINATPYVDRFVVDGVATDGPPF